MTTRILIGDCRDVLRTLPDESVHCVVTSPPYWGLRDYDVVGQLGLEPTYQEYLEHIIEVFREVNRVLRSDGTLWLNMGDSYASGGRGGNPTEATSTLQGGQASQRASMIRRSKNPNIREDGSLSYRAGGNALNFAGLKPKDLAGMPWRVAFALQADGWWLRQDIIWSKPNPMPESVTDRCTKAHEYMFLLSKSERYYFDAGAIAETVTQSTVERLSQPNLENQIGSDRVPGKTNGPMKAVGGLRKSDSTNESFVPGATPHGGLHRAGTPRSARDSFKREGSKREQIIPGQSVGTHRPGREESAWDTAKRNKRSVWTVTTQPFPEAHFATFPPALIEPCILAGCPEGGMVLDPFGGAGTTGLVADRLKRNAILIELNPDYATMARKRIAGDCPMFADVSNEEGAAA